MALLSFFPCLQNTIDALSCKFANQSRLSRCRLWHSSSMRKQVIAIALCLLVPLGADAQQTKTYRWVDADGRVYYSDSIPAKYAERPKQVLNEHAVTVEYLEGKKTPEQIEADRVAASLRVVQELRLRAEIGRAHV